MDPLHVEKNYGSGSFDLKFSDQTWPGGPQPRDKPYYQYWWIEAAWDPVFQREEAEVHLGRGERRLPEAGGTGQQDAAHHAPRTRPGSTTIFYQYFPSTLYVQEVMSIFIIQLAKKWARSSSMNLFVHQSVFCMFIVFILFEFWSFNCLFFLSLTLFVNYFAPMDSLSLLKYTLLIEFLR